MRCPLESMWSGMGMRGYVDNGNEMDDESNNVSTEAMVFILVSPDSRWKILCSYFLVSGVTGKEERTPQNYA